MDNNEPTIVNIIAQPTPKEQLVKLGFGIGASLAVSLITYGTITVADLVVKKLADRKAKKEILSIEQ